MKATTHGQGLPCFWGYPYRWLVHNINSASELRAIDKHLAGVEDKSKVIIARFDIGVVLPVHRERGRLES